MALQPLLSRMLTEDRLLPRLPDLAAALTDPAPRRVMTVNTHHLWAYAHSSAFRAAADRADSYTADGWPVAVLARIAGVRADRVTGRALCQLLIDEAWTAGPRRLAILGTTQEAALLFERMLQPTGRRVVFGEHGDRRDWRMDDLIHRLRSCTPDLLLVCVGSPHGEPLADELRQRLNTRVVSVGAALELAVGMERAAPNALSATGLEWAWRLVQNPRGMWRRYVLQCLPVLLGPAPRDGLAVRRALRRRGRSWQSERTASRPTHSR